MKFLITIAIIAAILAALFFAAHRLGWVRDGWLSELLGSWTARVNAFALTVLAWFQADPTSVLYAWNLLPRDVRALLPNSPMVAIGAALFIASMWARVRPKKA